MVQNKTYLAQQAAAGAAETTRHFYSLAYKHKRSIKPNILKDFNKTLFTRATVDAKCLYLNSGLYGLKSIQMNSVLKMSVIY